MHSATISCETIRRRAREGKASLIKYVTELCRRIAEKESIIQALLPETERENRLIGDIDVLYDRYPSPDNRPPFFGIPVAVKDIYRVDGFPTGCGSDLPDQLFQGPEAHAVRLLREAGALIIGKTVTTEFAFYEPGPTRNPRNPEHTPGGSSSGSAAAVAAGYCPLALGTQTIGSIIRPAAYCGIIGFKPTYGRISLEGVIPFSRSADHGGFFAQDVDDIASAAALLFNNWKDSDASVTGKPVIGIPEGPYLNAASREARNSFELSLEKIRQAGYLIRRRSLLEDIDDIALLHRSMIAAEFAEVHRTWRRLYGPLYRTRTAALIEEGMKVSPARADEGRKNREILRRRIESVMGANSIDLWASPAATGPAPAGIGSTGDPAMNLPWTHAGLPTVTIPSDIDSAGLPYGLQITGAWGADEKMLRSLAGITVSLARR
ncbi:MAG: amidase [Deltaproteobacteria bacterium]|nr:amidase [Deltaproteobacteria bacterium]